ncbi:glycosyltransferase family 2 protein [Neobacillus sedimentimangrovi]|uniref:glycosyltransferase family 2 protein n=1 Tax=Neobacillus sedimentimangrovi TaxID=2699460 RepID=UPI0013D52532|nr:glycosyltransferase [Neobacillus sedimentimangrovi]
MSKNSTPLISVVMSVYRTDNKFLREAIESILNQTYGNFEFLIIDDCTTKDNIKTILSYKDPRIKLIRNEFNLGLTKSLNKGIELATGKYIARMDADDISELDRFEKQIAFLENNPDVIVLGGYAQVLGSNKIFMSKVEDFEVLKMRMIFFNCALVHPTAMINKDLLVQNGIKYNETIKKSQDYMLWADCMTVKKIKVLDEVVLQYRIHESQASIANSEEQKQCAMIVQKKLLKPLLGEYLTDKIQLLHYSIVFGNYCASIKEYERHISTLIKRNNELMLYEPRKFKRECYFMWLLMSIKGAVFYRDFRGVASQYFWKALIHLDFWAYYIKYFLKVSIEEKKVIKKMNNRKRIIE